MSLSLGKRWFLVMALLMSVILPAWAIQAPDQLVKSKAEEMLVKLREEKDFINKNPGRINELVETIVLPHFDFERMSRWVLGKYWRTASDAQRERFTTEFRSLLVRTYATSLNEYTERKITYLPMRNKPDDQEVRVSLEVEQPGGFPITVDYDLYLKDGQWKVYDVLIDGVSLIANYRTTFSTEIRQDGLDKLIKRMSDRNRQGLK